MERPDDLSTADVDPGDALYSISLEGRDAPRRTVTFLDQSDLGDDLVLRFTTCRTIATVEVVKGSPECQDGARRDGQVQVRGTTTDAATKLPGTLTLCRAKSAMR